MFELPELVTLARQLNETVAGKTVSRGTLGNSPHKFVWYNCAPQEFAALTQGKVAGRAYARGKWLFMPLGSDHVLLLGEFGGKLLYHPPGADLPDKYHLWLAFSEGSHLTATTQMWGAMELHEAGEVEERVYVRDMRPTVIDAEFTLAYFSALIDELLTGEKRSLKALLTQDQLIPGLGNAISQDILFRAGLRPRRLLAELDQVQRKTLYDSIVSTVTDAIALGGRNDETDLYRRPGHYARLMDSRAAGRPCPVCGVPVEKIQFLGGACYFCPKCQM